MRCDRSDRIGSDRAGKVTAATDIAATHLAIVVVVTGTMIDIMLALFRPGFGAVWGVFVWLAAFGGQPNNRHPKTSPKPGRNEDQHDINDGCMSKCGTKAYGR